MPLEGKGGSPLREKSHCDNADGARQSFDNSLVLTPQEIEFYINYKPRDSFEVRRTLGSIFAQTRHTPPYIIEDFLEAQRARSRPNIS